LSATGPAAKLRGDRRREAFMLRTIAIASISTFALAGSALADTQTFDFQGFSKVATSAGVAAEIAVGGAYAVRAEGPAEALALLDIRKDGDKLKIGRKPNTDSWGRSDRVTVYVTMPALVALDASSGSHVSAEGVAGGPFEISASSGAHGAVSGRCDGLRVDVSSGAHVKAESLLCKMAKAQASSGAHAAIYASDNVSADASSGGHIRVHGDPKSVNQETSSGGRVRIEK
jgi:hypothetical protein